MRRIGWAAAVVAAVVPLAGAQVAGAAPWRAPVVVSSGDGFPFAPAAAISPAGSAVVAWSSFAQQGVSVQRIRPDGTLDGPVRTVDGAQTVADVRAGIADDGTVVVVWRRTGTPLPILRYARVTPAGEVVGEQDITPVLDEATEPRLAVHSDGTAVVAWETDQFDLRARTIGPEGALGTDRTLEDEIGTRGQARVAIGPQGAVVVWSTPSDPPTTFDVGFARLQLSGEVAVAPKIAAPGAVEGDVGLADDGTATLVWTTAGSPGRAQARRVFLDGGLGLVRDLSFAADDVREPRVAVAPDGSATATWLVLGPPRIGQARRIGADDVLGEVHRLPGTGGDLYETAVAAPAAGPALIVAGTSEQTPSLFRVEGFELDATGPPRPPDLISAQDSLVANSLALDVARTGAGVVAWRFGDGGGSRLEVSTLPAPAAPAPPPPVDPAPPVEEEQPAPPSVVAPPSLRSLTLSTRRVVLRPGVRPPVVRIGVRLNRAAPLRLAVTRTAPGRRRGARCVAPTRALIRATARPCVRTVPVATLVRPGRVGLNRIAITGLKVGRRALGPGVYRLRLTAGRAGALSRPLTTALRVVRAPRPR